MKVGLAFPKLLVLAAIICGLAACGPSDGTPGAGTGALQVTVSILPQQYFVGRIGGEYVQVNVMVQPGSNPTTYEPKPDQMRALRDARAYLSIGVPFEQAWMERIRSTNPRMRVVDTSQGVERQPMVVPHLHDGEAIRSPQENLDPHIWTSPPLVKVQARTVYEALAELDPAHETTYRANLDAFLADIDELDAHIRNALSGLRSRKFIVFHPSWGYFAREYGLDMIPIEIEGKEPSASELAELVAEAKEEGVKVIFAQPEFSTQSAQTIAEEIGGEVLLISPLALDWLDNMREVADTLARVLAEG